METNTAGIAELQFTAFQKNNHNITQINLVPKLLQPPQYST
jgi:hypothetical protein